MTPLEQRGRAIIRRLPAQARMAEVGVLLGKLSEYVLCNSDVAHLMMIDSWAPGSEQPASYKSTRDEHASHTAARVMLHRKEAENRAAHYPGRAQIICGWSADVASNVANGSLDMVFLDADHSYEGVQADIAAWLPKVRPGGWIGGHDYDNPAPGYNFSGVERAVDEWAAESGAMIETDENYTWFARCPG